jgi:AcrR family transcriptional regulator
MGDSATMKKPNAKDRILETASELFHQRGYSEVGVNEIIDKADTAKATFYQHFPSKELLCEAWLDAVHERSEVRCQAILEAPGKASEKIDQYFADLERYLKASDFRGCPYSNTTAVVESGCSGILKQVEVHKDSTREFFRALAADLTADLDASGFDSDQCVGRLGDALFVLYSGATTESQNLRELWPVEAARCAVAELCASVEGKVAAEKKL